VLLFATANVSMLSSSGGLAGELPFRLGDILHDEFGPPADVLEPAEARPQRSPSASSCAAASAVVARVFPALDRARWTDDGAGDVEALAGPLGLRLHAHGAHPRQQLAQLVGDGTSSLYTSSSSTPSRIW
jgi:hypothetical protein